MSFRSQAYNKYLEEFLTRSCFSNSMWRRDIIHPLKTEDCYDNDYFTVIHSCLQDLLGILMRLCHDFYNIQWIYINIYTMFFVDKWLNAFYENNMKSLNFRSIWGNIQYCFSRLQVSKVRQYTTNGLRTTTAENLNGNNNANIYVSDIQ